MPARLQLALIEHGCDRSIVANLGEFTNQFQCIGACSTAVPPAGIAPHVESWMHTALPLQPQLIPGRLFSGVDDDLAKHRAQDAFFELHGRCRVRAPVTLAEAVLLVRTLVSAQGNAGTQGCRLVMQRQMPQIASYPRREDPRNEARPSPRPSPREREVVVRAASLQNPLCRARGRGGGACCGGSCGRCRAGRRLGPGCRGLAASPRRG
jgi:hypothetical protein